MKPALAVAIAITAALSLIGDAFAQVTLEPANPKAFRDIRVKVPGSALGIDLDGRPDSYDPVDTQVTMAGNRITVSPLMRGAPDFSAAIPTPALDQFIGALPAGTYQIEVVRRASGRGSAGTVGSVLTFTVSPRQASEPLADYTDLWWVPAESGWGIGLFHHPSNQIFVTLFVHGADGKPAWYVIPSGEFVDPITYRGQIYKTTGPYFGGPFDPTQFHISPAGSGEINFDPYNLDKAAINFVIDGVRFVKFIERQSF